MVRYILPMTNCPFCGKKVKPNTKICPHCGKMIIGVKF